MLDLPVPSPLSPYEGGRVADIPCGTLRSATQTGLKSVSDSRKIGKSLGIIALPTIVTSKYRLGIHISIHAYPLHSCYAIGGLS